MGGYIYRPIQEEKRGQGGGGATDGEVGRRAVPRRRHTEVGEREHGGSDQGGGDVLVCKGW